jgi:hypothetical protein
MSDVITCKLCGGMPYAKVVANWSFRFDRDAPSQNDVGNNKGVTASRWKYRHERGAWVSMLSSWAIDMRIPFAEVKRRVTITRCYSGRQQLRDQGNLVGGLKAAVDAMVLCKLLKDDSPEWCEIYYHQRRVDSAERGTLITIEELA